ncbi:MAG: hypothetical protein ACLR23_10810 [Clostridia bacterium]
MATQYRHKSVSQILDELAVIQRQKTFPHIYFTDDNMLVQKKFSLELLEAFQGQRMRWMTHTDIGVAEQKEILSRLYAAGCRSRSSGLKVLSPTPFFTWRNGNMPACRSMQKRLKPFNPTGLAFGGPLLWDWIMMTDRFSRK